MDGCFLVILNVFLLMIMIRHFTVFDAHTFKPKTGSNKEQLYTTFIHVSAWCLANIKTWLLDLNMVNNEEVTDSILAGEMEKASVEEALYANHINNLLIVHSFFNSVYFYCAYSLHMFFQGTLQKSHCNLLLKTFQRVKMFSSSVFSVLYLCQHAQSLLFFQFQFF